MSGARADRTSKRSSAPSAKELARLRAADRTLFALEGAMFELREAAELLYLVIDDHDTCPPPVWLARAVAEMARGIETIYHADPPPDSP